jgi:hypothetical protein
MAYSISRAQENAWKHPLVLAVQDALARNVRPYEFWRVVDLISDILLTRGLVSNFLPMPFTADSADGKRLSAVLDHLRKNYPHSETIRTFEWRFWDPERESDAAEFMQMATGEDPIVIGAQVA